MVKYLHSNIISRDWRKLCDFYIEVFDCKVRLPERDLSGEWLSKGTAVPKAALKGVHLILPGYGDDGPTIEVFQYEQNIPREGEPQANREGFTHIAFAVDDVSLHLRKMIDHGGSALGEIVKKDFPVGLLEFVYAADPEGNIVEIQRFFPTLS